MRAFAAAALAAGCCAAVPAQAVIIGSSDDRVEIEATLRPFVAEISRFDDASRTLHRANGWQALHPQILATAAHVLAQDGVFLANQKTAEPTLLEWSAYEVKIAGCPEERYWITDLLSIGTLDSIGDPAQDFAVLLLNRPSCLEPGQLGVPLNVSDALPADLIYGASAPLVARLDAFMPRLEVAQPPSRTGLTSLETGPNEVALFESYGPLEPYFYRPVGNEWLVSVAHPEDPSSLSLALSWSGDADEGSSGGPVSVEGAFEVNGKIHVLDRVIGMQVQEINTPGSVQNLLSPYRGNFQNALEAAAKSLQSAP